MFSPHRNVPEHPGSEGFPPDCWILRVSQTISSITFSSLSLYRNNFFKLESPVAFVINCFSFFSRVKKADKCLHDLLFSNKCPLCANFTGKRIVKTFSKALFLRKERCVSFILRHPMMNGFQNLQRNWGVHNVRAGACRSMKSVIITLLNDSKQKLLGVVKYFPISVSKSWGKAICSRCFEFLSGNKAVSLFIKELQSSVKNSVLEICDFWGTCPWLKVT